MLNHQFEIRKYFNCVLQKENQDVILLGLGLLEEVLTLHHLISSQRIFEYPLESVDHHTKAVFEIERVPWLLLKQILDHPRDTRTVARSIYRRNVQQLGHVEQLVIVEQAFVKLGSEVFRVRLHVLTQSVEYLEYKLQLF